MTPEEIEAERSALRVEQQDITVAGDVLRAEVKNLDQHPTREMLTSLAERLHEHSARLRAYHERLEALHAAGPISAWLTSATENARAVNPALRGGSTDSSPLVVREAPYSIRAV